MSDPSSQVQPPAPSLQREEPAGGPDLTPAFRAPGPVPAFAAPRPRVWPAATVVALMWIAMETPKVLQTSMGGQFLALFLAPIAATLLLAVWWLFFSRLRWSDRWLGLGVCVAAGVGSWLLSSMNGMTLLISALPWVTTAWVLWLLATPFLPWPARRAGLLAAFVLVWGAFPLLRFEGVDGNMNAGFVWRWSPTAEDKALAELAGKGDPKAAAAAVLTLEPGDWPGFRGPNRDGRRDGVRIATDWAQNPPRELWRQRVCPGWGSFAVVGNRLYTQEQRGPDETVVCYNADTGDEIWVHKDATRFEEDVAKDGPRATPTFAEGRIYTLGAKGLLNCLDAATGAVLWSHDVAADSGAKTPQWGFASSPLVLDGVVTVFAGGPGGKSVLGYYAASGELLWSAGDGKLGYSSPQPARLGGVDQVLMATETGVTAFDPAHGDVLWRNDWPAPGMGRVLQPAVVEDSDVLVSDNQKGTRRLHLGRDGGAWAADEVWTTAALKPFFDDQVVYQGNLFGFDGDNLTCVNLEDGGVRWRKRCDHAGQILLLADQGLLLILWEYEGVSLVEASPTAYKELGRIPAIEHKTWNHPVVAHGKLFVRNSEWMACYQLAAERTGTAAK